MACAHGVRQGTHDDHQLSSHALRHGRWVLVPAVRHSGISHRGTDTDDASPPAKRALCHRLDTLPARGCPPRSHLRSFPCVLVASRNYRIVSPMKHPEMGTSTRSRTGAVSPLSKCGLSGLDTQTPTRSVGTVTPIRPSRMCCPSVRPAPLTGRTREDFSRRSAVRIFHPKPPRRRSPEATLVILGTAWVRLCTGGRTGRFGGRFPG